MNGEIEVSRMAVTMKNLYEKSIHLYELKCIAGERGLEYTVEWIHMIESAQAATFLHGRELIFITGVLYQGEEWLLHFVKCLHQQDAAGLVINIGPYIKKIPEKIIQYCAKVDLPLFTLPWKVHLVDFSRYLCRFIIDDEKKKQNTLAYIKQILLYPKQCEPAKLALEGQGFNVVGTFCVLLIHPCEQVYDLDEVVAILSVWNSSLLCFYYHDHIAVIVTDGDAEPSVIKNIGKEILEHLEKHQLHVMISIGETVQSVASLSLSYHQAESICAFARNMKRKLVCYEDMGIYKLLLNGTPDIVLQHFYKEHLGALIAYDETHQANLTETLKYYLDHDCSVKETALHEVVHRNTILYKFNKIEQILGISLSSEEDKLTILLAFKIKEII